MAIDLSQLQAIINNAEKNQLLVGEIRKAAKKVETALSELNEILAADYTPEVKERKQRVARAPKDLGTATKKAGRPKRSEKIDALLGE